MTAYFQTFRRGWELPTTFSINMQNQRQDRGGVVFCVIFVTLSLHMLRNAATFYYGVLGAVFLGTWCYSAVRFQDTKRCWAKRWVVLYCLCAVAATLQTAAQLGLSVAAYAAARFCLTIPLCILAYYALRTEKVVRAVLLLFCVLTAAGSLSVAIQYMGGQISWFAEPGSRAGIQRFGSLLGSLPTLGGAVPLALMIMLLLKMRMHVQLILTPILILGVCLSLSKAAILGCGVCLLAVVASAGKFSRRLLQIVMLGSAVAAAFYLLGDTEVGQASLRYATGIFDSSFVGAHARGGDVTVENSLVSRLTVLPRRSLEDLYAERGMYGYFTGGGFQMLGVALVPAGTTTFITSHSQLIDLLLVSGFPLLLAGMGVLLSSLMAFRKSRRAADLPDDIVSTCRWCLVLLSVSSVFNGGVFFQPGSACLLWTLVGIGWRTKQAPRFLRVKPETGLGIARAGRVLRSGDFHHGRMIAPSIRQEMRFHPDHSVDARS